MSRTFGTIIPGSPGPTCRLTPPTHLVSVATRDPHRHEGGARNVSLVLELQIHHIPAPRGAAPTDEGRLQRSEVSAVRIPQVGPSRWCFILQQAQICLTHVQLWLFQMCLTPTASDLNLSPNGRPRRLQGLLRPTWTSDRKAGRLLMA